MEPALAASNRWCVVEYRPRFSRAAIKRELYRGLNVCTGFTHLATPLPPKDQTVFKVYSNGQDLLVAVLLLDTLTGVLAPEFHDGLEVFFDPYHDHLGVFQFVITPTAPPYTQQHLPYAAAHSTAFPFVRLKEYAWDFADATHTLTPATCLHRWLFARFAGPGLFRNGEVCGFNVCRSLRGAREATSWNHCSGSGYIDATSFGHLYRRPPDVVVSEATARAAGAALIIAARGSAAELPTAVEVIGPDGTSQSGTPARTAEGWETTIPVTQPGRGRYRVYPRFAGKRVEPEYFFADNPFALREPAFKQAITYDYGDNVIVHAYDRDRLRRELTLWRDLGMSRIDWIDYPRDAPRRWLADCKQRPVWGRQFARNLRAMRRQFADILPVAVATAHDLGLEFVAVYKPYDVGTYDRPDLTMQANAAWRKQFSFPVTRLTVYSQEPVVPLCAADLRLWIAQDNRAYVPYRGTFTLRQGVVSRPHCRQSPAGQLPDSGAARNWFVELSGLRLQQPFVALEVRGREFGFRHRAFALLEASDAAGRDVPVQLATAGDRRAGFSFWQEWPSWANRSERILEEYTWANRVLGVTFAEVTNLPQTLEPAFAETRELWLEQGVRRALDAGADGVEIRILSHHAPVLDYLRCAFAEPVCAAFRAQFGREPTPQPEDYRRIRELRGACFTDFMRRAKELCARRGKRFGTHFEAGLEVPANMNVRMQVVYEWERWLREGLVDEITLKWWCARNPFIHEQVLPLARRLGIPVRICDRNSTLACVRAAEIAAGLVRDSHDAGFAGYTWYEAADYVRLNPEGVPTPYGNLVPAMAATRAALG